MRNFITTFKKLGMQFTDAKTWLFTFLLMPILKVVELYVFNDWQFLRYLFVLMVLDLLTGVWKAKIKGNVVTSEGLRRTVTKIVQYGIFLIVVHCLVFFQVQGKQISIFSWLPDTAYTFLMCIEAKSIWENLQAVDGRFDLSGFIDKLKQFLPSKKNDGGT